MFFGLGSDGTVGANKATVKIVGTDTDLFAQGYFVYDSKKSGSQTISHLRFSPRPITSTYLIDQAQFVGVHFFEFLQRSDVLEIAAPGAKVLINSPFGDDTWRHLPAEAQHQIIDKGLEVHVVDASAIARDAGLGRRVNTVLQTCYFALSDLMPTEDADCSHQGLDHQDLRGTRRGRAATQPQRGRRLPGRSAPSRHPSQHHIDLGVARRRTRRST